MAEGEHLHGNFSFDCFNDLMLVTISHLALNMFFFLTLAMYFRFFKSNFKFKFIGNYICFFFFGSSVDLFA